MRKITEKIDAMMFNAAAKVGAALSKKREGLDGFVVVIIIIAVAIAVGFVFKDQITAFITGFFAQFTTKTNTLF